MLLASITWNTLGALTREARAEESVAEKMPAVMRGPNPDTMLMTLRKDTPVRRLTQHTIKKQTDKPSQNLTQTLPLPLSVIWNLRYKSQLLLNRFLHPCPHRFTLQDHGRGFPKTEIHAQSTVHILTI